MNKLTTIWAAVFLTALLFLSSCSTTKRASWHIKRAVELDPSIVNEKVDTLYIPEVSIDTFFTVDTISIPSDIDSILASLSDSCKEEAQIIIRDPLIKYVKEREIILDTLMYKQEIHNDSLDLVLYAKVWQDGTDIKLKIVLESAVIRTKDVQVVEQSRESKLGSLVLGLVLSFLIIYLIVKIIKKWLNS